MTTSLYTLDALGAALAASFRNANAILARMPSAVQRDTQIVPKEGADDAVDAMNGGGNFYYWLRDGIDTGDPVQAADLPDVDGAPAAVWTRHTKPLASLFPERRLALASMEFELRCYRLRHAAIATRRPSWWSRMFTPAFPVRLAIRVVDEMPSIRFRREFLPRPTRATTSDKSKKTKKATTTRPSSRGSSGSVFARGRNPDWVFTLTPEQAAKIKKLGRDYRRLHRLRGRRNLFSRVFYACLKWWRR